MILVIAGQPGHAYLQISMALLFRLFALLALVLMPIGMGLSTAPATAATPGMHATMDMPADGHCGDQKGKSPTEPLGTHCGGSCSALPGIGTPAIGEVLPPSSVVAPSMAPTLVGISHLPSTPPPRTA